jgi:outer membrane lipase/esterase
MTRLPALALFITAPLFITCIVCAQPASATTFDAVYVFGDSTVDGGWWKGALNGQCGPVASPCATGNATKDSKIFDAIQAGGNGAPVGVGTMNTQLIAQHYGLSALPANQSGGTNFAISGALSANVVDPNPAIVGNLNANPNLPATAAQISSYLAAHANAADPSALYLVSSGGNDITYAQDHFMGLANREAFLQPRAAALAASIQTLALDGAQHIVVYGTQGSGNLALFWTSQLFADLAALNVKFIGADIAGFIENVEQNPTAFGFTAGTVMPGIDGPTNTQSACIAGVGATGWGQFCGNVTTPQMNFAHLRDANAEQESFWADDQHLSAAGQALEAEFVIAQIESPLPGALPLFVSGLGALGLIARRRRTRPQITPPGRP